MSQRDARAEAIAANLECIGTAEARAAQSYHESVQAQRSADATAIPKLTAGVLSRRPATVR
jgi:hypothetical protein